MPSNLNTNSRDQTILENIKIVLETLLKLLIENIPDNLKENIFLTLSLGAKAIFLNREISRMFMGFRTEDFSAKKIIELLFGNDPNGVNGLEFASLLNTSNIVLPLEELISLVNILVEKFPEIESWVSQKISTAASTIKSAASTIKSTIVELMTNIKIILSAICTNIINFNDKLYECSKGFFPMFIFNKEKSSEPYTYNYPAQEQRLSPILST